MTQNYGQFKANGDCGSHSSTSGMQVINCLDVRVPQTTGDLCTKLSPFLNQGKKKPTFLRLPCCWVQQSDWVLTSGCPFTGTVMLTTCRPDPLTAVRKCRDADSLKDGGAIDWKNQSSLNNCME